MHLTQLITYFETSPAVRLLRSQNAPFVVDFLHALFSATCHGCPMRQSVIGAISMSRAS